MKYPSSNRRKDAYRERKPLAHAAAALLTLGALGMAPPASARVFVVDNANDFVDLLPGDGQCNFGMSGFCSLRAAVMEANAFPTNDRITFDPALNGVNIVLNIPVPGQGEGTGGPFFVPEEDGDLDIRSTGGRLVVEGNGVADTHIRGGNLDRIFHIHAGADAVIRDVDLRRGRPHTGDDADGSAVLVQGAARARLIGVRAGNNNATIGDGAIAVEPCNPGESCDTVLGGLTAPAASDFLMRDSRIVNNFSTDGGGIEIDGQDVQGHLIRINDTVIRNNHADTDGGGLRVVRAVAYLRGNTVRDNVAGAISPGGNGGGLYNGDGAVVVANTGANTATFRGNLARMQGGAVFLAPGAGSYANFAPGAIYMLNTCQNSVGTAGQPCGASIGTYTPLVSENNPAVSANTDGGNALFNNVAVVTY
jgi:hypothetical protein